MNTVIYLCWVDDIKNFPGSFSGHLEILKQDYEVSFIIDEHTDTDDFDVIARNITDDLVFFVDFNLKKHNGHGIDGHEVIGKIRSVNKVCKIVFYSSKATQKELRALINEFDNVICTTREDGIKDVLTKLAKGEI